MRQAHHTLLVQTRGKGLSDITRPVLDWVAAQEIANEDARSITVRDVLTDELLATVHPQVAA